MYGLDPNGTGSMIVQVEALCGGGTFEEDRQEGGTSIFQPLGRAFSSLYSGIKFTSVRCQNRELAPLKRKSILACSLTIHYF